MDKLDKRELIEKLWQKYCYRHGDGFRSDKKQIAKDYEEIMGEPIPERTLGYYIVDLDKERLYRENTDVKTYTKVSRDAEGIVTSEIRRRMSEMRKFTNRELLELHAINPDENEIKQIASNEWSMTNKDGDTFYNFQSKIIAVPIKDGQLKLEEFAKLLRQEPKNFKIDLIGIGTRNLVVGIADTHFPSLNKETLQRQVSEIVEIMREGFDIIVFEQLGDMFESSQMKETITLRGTVLPTVDMVQAIQDAKQFWHTLIDNAIQCCNKVQVEHACGNHSGNLEYMFLEGLKDRYSLLGKDKVEVNNHNEWRTAYRLGNVGIMISHGDGVKLEKLPGRFADEYPVLWGSTEHHEVHAGHKHSQMKIQELDGVVMRQFPTPKEKSDWEKKYGYSSRPFIELIEYEEDRSKTTHEI